MVSASTPCVKESPLRLWFENHALLTNWELWCSIAQDRETIRILLLQLPLTAYN